MSTSQARSRTRPIGSLAPRSSTSTASLASFGSVFGLSAPPGALSSQLYPRTYARKWLTQNDEKQLDSGALPPVSVAHALPLSSINGHTSSNVNNSSSVQQVRQLLLTRGGGLASLARLEDALEASTAPTFAETLEIAGEEDADEDENALYIAEVEGRMPWLQRAGTADTLSAAALAHGKESQPPPSVVAKRSAPSFPVLDAETKAEVESTCSQSFLCSITCEIMQQPVVAADGHTYERAAIERWLTRRDISPLTGEVLASKQLTPNHALRSIILECVEAKIKQRSAATAP